MSTGRSEAALTPIQDHVGGFLREVAAPRFLVAFSGGLDSTVLLHAVANRRPSGQLLAAYIDHGLQPAAADWSDHCRRLAGNLRVPFACRRVHVDRQAEEGTAAAARRVRYAALAGLMGEGDCLLTAHHLDDQAETVMLQLLRGCGPHGLAAMAERSPFGPGTHARPLLAIDREALLRYARAAGLEWIQDPSNRDRRYRRNFLRHEVMPRLRTVWPAASTTLARSARHAASAARLLDERARDDLAAVAAVASGAPVPTRLSVAGLQGLGPDRLDNLLRYWVRSLGLPIPPDASLGRIREDVLAARRDAQPLVNWPGAEVRRYQGDLYALAPLPPVPPEETALRWIPAADGALALPGGGLLRARVVEGGGLRRDVGPCVVRFRQGGERCRPAGSRHHHRLRNLLQEAAVPPWLRPRIPLLYLGDILVAVPGVCVAQGFQASAGESGWALVWSLLPGPGRRPGPG